MLKILKKLWTHLKEDVANVQVQYDYQKGIFICGEAPKLASTAPTTLEPRVVCEYPNMASKNSLEAAIAACGCGGRCVAHLNATQPYIKEGWHQCMSYNQIGNEKPNRCMVMVGPHSSFCHTHQPLKHNVPANSQSKICSYKNCMTYISVADKYCVKHDNFTYAESLTDDTDLDSIDEDLCKRIGSVVLKNRGYRKQYDMDTIHYRLEVRGKRDDITMFHLICHAADHDYPFKPTKDTKTTVTGCEKCHGYVWKNCVLLPADVKRAAKQAGVYVKFKFYTTEIKCGGQTKQVAVGASL